MLSEESRVDNEESSKTVSQAPPAPVAPALSPPPADANELASLPQSQCVLTAMT